MKRIITLFSILFCAGMIMAQEPALKVAASGNVGIGTANPQTTLHIKGQAMSFEPVSANTIKPFNVKSLDLNTRFNFQSYTNTTESWSYFLLYGNEDGGVRRGEVGFFGQYHKFNAGVTDGAGGSPFGSEAMRITSGGKLAVGQTSVPNAHVAAFNGTIQVNGTTIGSDRKLKSNIRDFKYGLDEIMRMSPKFYNYNGDILADDGLKVGIIAQEFEKIIPEAVSVVDYRKHDDITNEIIEEGTYKAVNTDIIKFTLVNALQEQQEMINELRAENEDLRKMITEVVESLAVTETQIDASINGNAKVATLAQNSPNPFNGQTELRYFIPDNSGQAQMIITSNSGQIVKTVNIDHKGDGVISLTGNDIPVGNYHYTLSIDGNKVDTKTMTLVK